MRVVDFTTFFCVAFFLLFTHAICSMDEQIPDTQIIANMQRACGECKANRMTVQDALAVCRGARVRLCNKLGEVHVSRALAVRPLGVRLRFVTVAADHKERFEELTSYITTADGLIDGLERSILKRSSSVPVMLAAALARQVGGDDRDVRRAFDTPA